MTWSTPSERTSSTFRVLPTPVTLCAEPWRSAGEGAHATRGADDQDVLTGLDLAVVGSPWRAVMAETPRAEASSNVRFPGLCAGSDQPRRHAWAKAPEHRPRTASPSWKRVTSAPTASTVPAMSVPGTAALGRRSPYMGRKNLGTPRMTWQSPMCTEAAWMRTSTWPALVPGLDFAELQDVFEGTVTILDDGFHWDSPSPIG